MLWKFILVNSNDLSQIGELSQARDRKLQLVINKPGQATFTYPMNVDYSADIQPYKTGIKAMRWNRISSFIAGRAVWDCIWSGYVLPINETVDANRMSISCVGWLQRLAKRFVRRDMIFTNVDDGEIVRLLLAEMNLAVAPDGYNVPTPTGSVPNTPTWLTWGGTQPDQGAGGATAYVVANRSKTVQKYTYVLPMIEELNTVENGGDIVVNPLTREITWHRRYRRVMDDVVLGFQWGPQNVQGFGRNIEADAQVNYFLATGAPATIPQYAEDRTQMNEIGLIEETAALSDVVDNNILLTYAGAEIIVRSNGHITYSVQPFPVPYDRDSGIPEPFREYRLGDQGRLTAVHAPRIDVRGQAVRVFGMDVDISNEGKESLGPLQVAP